MPQKSQAQPLNLVTFRASSVFWDLFEGHTLPKRRSLVLRALLQWDGLVRPFPAQWRGQDRELSLPTLDVAHILRSIDNRNIARTTALFSAIIQIGLGDKTGKQTVTQAPPEQVQSDTPERAVTQILPKADAATQAPARPDPGTAKSVANRNAGQKKKESPDAPPHDEQVTPEDAKAMGVNVAQLGVPPGEGLILLSLICQKRKEAIESLRAHKSYVFEINTGAQSTGDEADQAEIAAALRVQGASLARARRQLVEADSALQRMRDGQYGWCEDTGEPIGFRRLLAQPFARLCIDAQERLESKLRTMGYSHA